MTGSGGHRLRLRVYLNDHLAVALGALRLARRCRANNASTPLGASLDRLVAELQEEYRTLRGLISHLGLEVAWPKELAAVAGERAARFKLNGQLTGYSPLSRLLELEMLSAAVGARRNLWRALVEVGDLEPAVGSLDLDALIARAEAQCAVLEEHRREAVIESLAARG